MKTPDTKTILNVTLIVAIIVVGKKLGETLGLFKTQADTTAEELESGSTANVTDTSATAPVGLALNPLYWKSIYKAINDQLKKQNKPVLTGKQLLNSLTIEGTNPLQLLNKEITVLDFIKKIVPDKFLNVDTKLKAFTTLNTLELTYGVLCIQIKESKGIFLDDPEIINGVFQKLNSKAQISFLSNVFLKMYNLDLLSYLKNFLNSEEQTKIYKIIKNKPLYKNI